MAGLGRDGGATFQNVHQLIEAPVRRAHEHDLGAVDGTAAAQGHDALGVGVFAPQALVHRRDPAHIRVGLDIGFHGDETVAQQWLDPGQQPQGDRLGKSHEKGAAILHPFRKLSKRSRAGVDSHGISVVPERG